jgi:hypothetical protein
MNWLARVAVFACILVAIPLVIWWRGASVAPPAVADHQSHDAGTHVSGLPTEFGQDAFAAITEILLLLEADPNTDWTKVNLEGLRQHLRDMHLVVTQATVTAREIDGGAEFVVTGPGDVADAAQRMAVAHAMMTAAELPYEAVVTPSGRVTTVALRAKDPTDAVAVAKVRGIGFVGWLASGGHHRMHHLGVARGEDVHSH